MQTDPPVEIALFSCTISHTFAVTSPAAGSYWLIEYGSVKYYDLAISASAPCAETSETTITSEKGSVGWVSYSSVNFEVPVDGGYSVEMHSLGGRGGDSGANLQNSTMGIGWYDYHYGTGGGGGGSGVVFSNDSLSRGTSYDTQICNGVTYQVNNNYVYNAGAFVRFDGAQLSKGSDGTSGAGYSLQPAYAVNYIQGEKGLAGAVSGTISGSGWIQKNIATSGQDGTGYYEFASQYAVPVSGGSGGTGGSSIGNYGQGQNAGTISYVVTNTNNVFFEPTGNVGSSAIIIKYIG